jgi:arsenate reductase (glutaredoxin)
MSDKIFYLKSCSTCIRIIKELGIDSSIELREIKSNPVSGIELDELAALIGSFEALFSRKSQKYRPMGLHEKKLSQEDCRNLILEEYTFLKRPVFLIGGIVYAGNSPLVVEEVKKALVKKNA